MSRKIFRAIADSTHTTAVIETTARGGSSWGKPVRLATVRFANEDIELLQQPKIHGDKRIESIAWQEVDGRNTGPRSRYGQILEKHLDKLPSRVSDSVMDTGVIPEHDREWIGKVVGQWREQMQSLKNHAALQASTVQAGIASLSDNARSTIKLPNPIEMLERLRDMPSEALQVSKSRRV